MGVELAEFRKYYEALFANHLEIISNCQELNIANHVLNHKTLQLCGETGYFCAFAPHSATYELYIYCTIRDISVLQKIHALYKSEGYTVQNTSYK